MCRDIRVDRYYLRVLPHRAKDKFKASRLSMKKSDLVLCPEWPDREFAKRFSSPPHYLAGRDQWSTPKQCESRRP